MDLTTAALWALPVGAALDLLVGDPRGWPHPVRAIGWLVTRAEGLLRRGVAASGSRAWVESAAGVVLAVVVTGVTAAGVAGVVGVADASGAWTSLAVRALLIHWGLAVRSLRDESLKASESADLDRARAELAMIVGRDTAALDRPEICRACVETVAENCNDAVVAPLFWYAVGGVTGLWAYKAVNTLDSMVGYRDERYRRIGWASARLDDLAGYVPARLTWLLISLASVVARERAAGALRVGWRDGRKHPSPNAGWGEAAMAGALGVQLGGRASYRGVPSEKPRLGEPGPAIDPDTVRRSIRVMLTTALLAVALAGLARAWVLAWPGLA
jgi:adenosylcobinamide-phosphate synthase